MAIARHGSTIGADLAALRSQAHPVFVVVALAASWFGAAVAGEFAVGVALVHATAMVFAAYTAHVKDGYVDCYGRGGDGNASKGDGRNGEGRDDSESGDKSEDEAEDGGHPMTRRGCRLALAGAAFGFAACTLALGVVVGPGAAFLTLPAWLVGYLHAPHLDANPVTATLGYPVGVALAVLGGYYVQTTTLSEPAVGFALVVLVTLAGVKILYDERNGYDRSAGKRTASVVLEAQPARTLAVSLVVLGLFGVLWGTVSGHFPPSSPVAALAFGSVVLVARSASPKTATTLLVRGAVVFLALLLVVVWFRPLSGTPLPDVTALGPYTYLATEIVFGAIALGLLSYAGALRSAARTVVALYPVAYVWDWYTLEVGVFEITMRTGYDLFGIPVEEHLFMVVVPALVVGVHETIGTLSEDHGDDGSEPTPPTATDC